jgi:hypothetical protein
VERVRPATLDSWGVTLNSNNHPKDPDDDEVATLSYKVEISKTHLSRYRDILPYPVAWEHNFHPREVSKLMEAAKSGILRGKVSKSVLADLEPVVERLQADWQDAPDGLFFRFDGASPKDGQRAFPARKASEVVWALVTSRRALRALEDGQNTLYFVHFDPTWDESREFRVFVRRGRVTAISQYSPWWKGMLSDVSDEDARRWAEKAVVRLEGTILPPLLEAIGTSDVVCDVYAPSLDGEDVRVVELNSFGYWLASGSALFHWITDRDVLYGLSDSMVVRVVR